VTTTIVPARVLNTVTLNAANEIAGAVQGAGQWAGHMDRPAPAVSRRRTETVRMHERVLIPTELLGPDVPPVGVTPEPGNADPAAVTEVADNATVEDLDGRALNITRTDLLNRDAVAFGFDPVKLRIMFDLAMARFTGATRPAGQPGTSFNHTGLAADGSRAQDAMHYLMSYQMFTRQLENMLGARFDSPQLIRKACSPPPARSASRSS